MPKKGPKTPSVIHSKVPYMEGSSPNHVFTSANEPAPPSESLVLVSGGYGSMPEDYFLLARSLVEESGTPVVVVDATDPAPNAESKDPFTNRGDVLRYSTDAAVISNKGVKRVIWIAHSMSAAVQARASENPPDTELEAMVALYGAGSGRINLAKYMLEAPRHLKDTPRQLWDTTAISMQAFVNTARNPRSVTRRFDVRRHYREFRALLALEEGHNAAYYEQAIKAGTRCLELTAPYDTVIDSRETRRINTPVIGEENVVDAYPNAGHFSPQTQPLDTARAILRILQETNPAIADNRAQLSSVA